MALTLGTNAYITLADFKTWAGERGYDLVNYLDSEIEAAITISSVDFIDARRTFKGEALADPQDMQLPTDEVAIADIEKAAAYAAWAQLNGKLFVDFSAVTSSGQVESESKSVGSLSKQVTYRDGTQLRDVYPTRQIDALLRPYVIYGGLGTVNRW